MLTAAVLIGLTQLFACGLGGQSLSFAEAKNRLDQLVEPAADAMFLDAVEAERTEGTHACALTDTRNGVAPTLFLKASISELSGTPDELAARAEEAWRSVGLAVDVNDSDDTFSRFIVGEGGYTVSVLVNRSTGLAWITGSGPCVEDPDAQAL